MRPSESDIGEIIITASQLRSRVRALAREINAQYEERSVHLISVLKGGVFFLTDLARALTVPNSIDFLAISSYGSSTSSGEVRITKDLDDSISDRHVLIVEDIVDTGLTLGYIYRSLERRKPASLTVCTLLDRPYRRIVDIDIRYKGFDVPDKFLVGYGLDWKQRYRNLPFIAALKAEALRQDERP